MRRSAAPLALLFLVLMAADARAQGLIETLSATKIQQEMAAGNAAAATAVAPPQEAAAAAPAPSAPGPAAFSGTKYLPAYAVVLMLIALGGFIICRPSRRRVAE